MTCEDAGLRSRVATPGVPHLFPKYSEQLRPEGTSSFDFIRFKQLIEDVLGREVDLVSYGGLKASIDDDIRREAMLL